MTGEPSSIQMLSKPVRLQNLKAKTLTALENLTSPLMGDPSPPVPQEDPRLGLWREQLF